jgi:hypothetical protein
MPCVRAHPISPSTASVAKPCRRCPVADLNRELVARRVDARLPVEANVSDHHAASFPPDDGAGEPALDVRVSPQLADPVTEEAVPSSIDRLGRKRGSEHLFRFGATAGEDGLYELRRHRDEVQPQSANGRHIHDSEVCSADEMRARAIPAGVSPKTAEQPRYDGAEQLARRALAVVERGRHQESSTPHAPRQQVSRRDVLALAGSVRRASIGGY